MGGLYEEIRASVHAVWMRRWIALAVAWAVCLAGWVVVSRIPNKFESTARVQVQLRQVLPSQGAAALQAQQAQDIDRVRQTLTSAMNLEKVVRGTALANTVQTDVDVAARVAGLQNAIKVVAVQDDLFEISATLANGGLSDRGNAKLAQSIVQKMIDIFIETNLQNSRDQTGQDLTFLDQQIAQRQKQLQDKENARQAFNAQYLGGLPGTGSLSDRMDQAQTQINQADSDLSAAKFSLEAINGQLGSTAPSLPGVGGAVAGPAHARLATIESQIADGRARGWTDQHPDMQALISQLGAARAAASREGVGGVAAAQNPTYVALKAQQADRAAKVAELTDRKAQLQAQLEVLKQKLASDPDAAARQAQLDNDIESLKQTYSQLTDSREQLRLQSQVQTQTNAVKFQVIDPPTLPGGPTSPNRPLLLAGVLIAGIGAGIGAAFALARVQTTFATAGRLERASGMPVIGSIGRVLTGAQIQFQRKRMLLFAGGAGALVLAFVGVMSIGAIQRALGT